MANKKARGRRIRRTTKQQLKAGHKQAKRPHKRQSGRTGSIQGKRRGSRKRRPVRKPVVWVVEQQLTSGAWILLWCDVGWTREDATTFAIQPGSGTARVRAYERRG